MAATAGKNKIERGFRAWVDNASGSALDLSGDLVPGSVSGGGLVFDEAEMTGVSNTVKNYLAAHPDAPIEAQFHLNDTTTSGAHTVLNDLGGVGGTVTLQWGSDGGAGGAPASGDPEWEGEYVLLQNLVTVDGGKFLINTRFMPEGGQSAPAWTTVGA